MQTNLQRPQRLFAQPIRYDIPAFQRRYVWKQEEQWEPLWDDVEQLAQSIMEDGRTDPHFMGAVVLQQMQFPTGTIERRIVVDGQQRLTTLQLLIDAIQEVLEIRGHSGPAKRLAALVENPEEFRDGDPDNGFKVWPTIVDRIAFRHAMSNALSATGFAASRIVQAHDYFRGQAEQWLDRSSDETGDLDTAATALESAVRVNLELVVIDLGDADDPHVIFETLNARGTPLLQSDMIKNKVLHDANIGTEDEDSISSEQRRLWPFDEDDWWDKEIGRGVQRRPRIDVFLNHWLTLRNQRVMRAHEEFRAFEKYVTAQREQGKSISDVADDMKLIGNIYRDVEQVRRADIAKFLERRSVMNVGAVTPLLLRLLSTSVPEAALEKCLKALESFLVRRVVCGYGAKGYGELFVSLITRLAAAPDDNADRVVISFLADQTAQATIWPGDAELRERFLTAPLYQWLTRGRLRMVLTGIEEQLRTVKSETQEASPNLQIEHIMPQAWSTNWPLASDHDADDTARRDRAIHTIGNLTLVNGRLNPSLSNAPWDTKRKAFADHSVLFLNKRLMNDGPQCWDENAVEDRARWLHNQAIKMWPHHADIGRN